MNDRRIIVIGGGIGGITAAAALQSAGLPITVFEKQPKLSAVGTGVAIQNIAQRALETLGLLARLHAISGEAYQEHRFLAHDDGRVLASIPRFGEVVVVHRGELLQMLFDSLKHPTLVRLDSECVGFEQDEHGVTARFADGREERGLALIGADGQKSVIRAQVVADGPPRFGGMAGWRAMPVYRHPTLAPDMSYQVFGPGAIFGLFPAGDRLFWWAGARKAEGVGDAPIGRKAELLELYAGWPHSIPEVIDSTPEKMIDRADLYDRPPVRNWTVGRVTLLGDAAHPTMPSLGQGAGMAIEDGVVLARELVGVEDLARPEAVEGALRRYQERRMPRADAVVKKSWKISRMSRWEHPALVAARATLLSRAPKRLWQKTGEREHTYEL